MSDNKIAILPLGAFEQHGPHLPPETDNIIVEGFIHKLKSLLPEREDIIFLPTEKIGYSIEHNFSPVTKTLSYEKAIERWINIGKECSDNNIKKLLCFNAHGGNSPLLTIVATELRARYRMLCCVTAWPRFLTENNRPPLRKNIFDIHAGFYETSLILALQPEKVNKNALENFANKQEFFTKNFHYLRAYGPQAFGWMMPDLNEKGACGDAASASRETGLEILNHVSQQIVLLLDDMKNFDLSLLK